MQRPPAFILILLALLLLSLSSVQAQTTDLVTYAGSTGKEAFYDVVQLSNGHFLVGGYAEDLNWIDPQVPRTVISLPSQVMNSQGNNRFGFLLEFTSDLSTILTWYTFPKVGRRMFGLSKPPMPPVNPPAISIFRVTQKTPEVIMEVILLLG